ncbi:MerR family transcriptional regulator [Mycolicibacterium aubagnense]|uniref:MerR family transcriptional regulator n=1 Tax=Mycolicibacterium aubagnense TaxID=319707 RepID=A0ABM7IGQ8_9MYCO|nr:MerR family transcriptional regulator [Mycolicibacterium aubagnense]TLH70229.1 MerR family transcriptional regulator [Mycolicibacterium aubagnense]WGI32552.1 MerR family transcriptional regulator [Mycolicibacterium aubagnense]BBX85865.1 MerR family transcriptional regulator [Mycolicibacterium aubagnense]
MATFTIGEVSVRTEVAATTLRYYEQIGLIPAPARVGGQRRYDDAVIDRLHVIRLCKTAGFSLDEIQLLFADEAPGRPASRALAETKLAEIDAKIAELHLARAIVEWGVKCTCPSIDACNCGIHPVKPWDTPGPPDLS